MTGGRRRPQQLRNLHASTVSRPGRTRAAVTTPATTRSTTSSCTWSSTRTSVEQVLQAEVSGKNRSTLVDWLEEQAE